jgi:cold shock protein
LTIINFLQYKMRTGKVKFFNESKGYGFITDDETGKDIFVHASGMRVESLNEGDAVSYEEEEGRKGKVAAQVVVIED